MTDAVASSTTPGLEAYERFALLHGPSPVHRLARLTEYLGGPEIWTALLSGLDEEHSDGTV